MAAAHALTPERIASLMKKYASEYSSLPTLEEMREVLAALKAAQGLLADRTGPGTSPEVRPCGHERKDVSGVDALALAEYHLDELGFALLALKARLAGLPPIKGL
jgi:hypothetical protein